MAFDSLIVFFDNILVFIFVCIILMAFFGFLAKSFAVGAFGGFVLFTYLAMSLDIPLLSEFLYLLMFIIILMLSFWIIEKTFGQGVGGS